MPKFEKNPPADKPAERKTRTRRPLVVTLAVRLDGAAPLYSDETPWQGQTFPTVDAALAAAALDPEYCQKNEVHAITVSPRIVPKVYQPRKPVMVFDAPPVPASAPSAPYSGLSNGPSPEGAHNE